MFLYTDFIVLIGLLGFSSLLVGLGYFVGNFSLNVPETSYEKVSSYECGFDAFSDAREPFDIKFYLIAILFIIFDVEVLFFFPWVMTIKELFIEGFYVMLVFMAILMIGFAYEWKKGCMDWE
jgi:NADH-quinone oxidoreductase subunit A